MIDGDDAARPTAEVTDNGVARRMRFREAASRLSQRARGTDLLQVVLMPAAIAVVAGFLFLGFGWWGAAHTARQIEQVPYLISGGLVGVALVFVGGLLLASAVWLTALKHVQEEADARARRQFEALEERLRAEMADVVQIADRRPRRSPARARTARS